MTERDISMRARLAQPSEYSRLPGNYLPWIMGVICGVAAVADDDRCVRCRDTSQLWEVEMAQRVTVALEDDLDGGPADETVRFGLGGAEYEIDLSKKNASAFRKQFMPFIEQARKFGRGQPRRSARTAASRQRSGDIRAWAKDHGISVSERGRIPASVVEQYQTATKGR
jgi:hypothetical protein